jgi:hypothetical protein
MFVCFHKMCNGALVPVNLLIVVLILLSSGCRQPNKTEEAAETWETWDAFRKQWQEKGEVFDYRVHIPETVPSEKNFAHTPLLKPLFEYDWNDDMREAEPANPAQHSKAISLFKLSGKRPSLGQWQAGHAVDLVAWQEYFRGQEDFLKGADLKNPAKAQPDQAASDVLQALTVFGEEMTALLIAAKERPLCRFDVRYEAHLNAKSPHLFVLMQAARCFTLRAVAYLAEDDPNAAFTDAGMVIFLARSIAGEPTLISHLVRIAILEQALQVIWQGLAKNKWSNEQLGVLRAKLSSVNLVQDLRLALLYERDMFNLVIDQMIRKPVSQWQEDFRGLGEFKPPPGNQVPWLEQNQIRLNQLYLKFGRNLVDVKNGVIHPGIAAAHDDSLEKLDKNDPHNLLVALVSMNLSGVAIRFGNTQTGIDHACIAAALEQKKMKDGKYPGEFADLAELSVSLARGIPSLLRARSLGGLNLTDPFSGDPYFYFTGTRQYSLYGTGWNLKDDGGKVIMEGPENTRIDKARGDRVWPYVEASGK